MPRILTNKKDLPLPIYLAIKNDSYEPRGDISTTTLIDSPYIRILKKYNTYEEDASMMIWALQGQAMHSVLERVGNSFNGISFLPEKQLMIKVYSEAAGRYIEVSGTSDLIEGKEADNFVIQSDEAILHDYKNVSAYVVKAGQSSSSYKKWTYQLNIYRHMILLDLSIEIKRIYVHAFIRDWSRLKAVSDKMYPELPVETFSIPAYSHASIEKYIKHRVELHFSQENLFLKEGIDAIEPCSPEDRWARPTVWKIVKVGGKRSIKNFVILSDADKVRASLFAEEKNSSSKESYIIEVENGIDTRCVEFCPVKSFCKYWKKTYGEKEEGKGIGIGSGGELFDIQESPVEKNKTPNIDFGF